MSEWSIYSVSAEQVPLEELTSLFEKMGDVSQLKELATTLLLLLGQVEAKADTCFIAMTPEEVLRVARTVVEILYRGDLADAALEVVSKDLFNMNGKDLAHAVQISSNTGIDLAHVLTQVKEISDIAEAEEVFSALDDSEDSSDLGDVVSNIISVDFKKPN